jgi:hypothetical protein
MHKSTLQSVAVFFLLLTAAAGFCHAQSIKVPAVRRAVPAPAPAPVAPAVSPAAVPAALPAAGLPVLTCAAGASGVLGAPFVGPAMTASVGTPPYAPDSTTDLPTGLTMDPSTGNVSGTPTSGGNFNVKVKDHAGAISAASCPITITAPPGGLSVVCFDPGADGMSRSYVGMAFNSVKVTGGASPYKFSSTNTPNNLSMGSTTGVISGASTKGTLSSINIKVTDNNSDSQTVVCSFKIDDIDDLPGHGSFFPTHYMGSSEARIANINSFFNTDGKLSFINQVKSIYNGASNSATVSADLASLNFSAGWQVTLGTNIQAGASSPTAVSAGTVPTLSATSAGQATQNMLYGGTITASGLYPLLAAGAANLSSTAGVGFMVDFLAKEGVDIQSFKSGTSTNVNNPTSHTSAQVEGYLQFNSTNLAPGSTSLYAGAIFVGGSYGYSYMSHDYARDYGFATHVNNGVGQISAGFLINNVANIALSRAFGPSQTYIDSTSMAPTTANYFKAWSFGITYQSSPATK